VDDIGADKMDLGASLKLLGNSIILGAVQLYAESYALSDAIGFDPAVFHELHRGSHGVSVEHQLT
jgi:3-hydroxyisobutyrate dehydrogenase-like beta-hydroxyacid dehydrogenase